jgi:FlaA1/EpsC-like NDP-sugar epimerase
MHREVGESSPDTPAKRPRTLVVGTALSVRQLRHALAVAEPMPEVVGCVLPAIAVREATGDAAVCEVLGSIDELEGVVSACEPELVLVSLPLAMRDAIGQAAATLGRSGVSWRFMPTLDDQLAGRTTSRITGGLPTTAAGARGAATASFVTGPIDPTRLIDRASRPLDEEALAEWIGGRRVLITGAGGSIGSELARVVARFGPGHLALVERSENALFEIDRELARTHPGLSRSAVLHDVTQRDKTFDVLEAQRPDVVLHAAAHKHVPMMENHPAAAIENNFYGTRAIADASVAVGAERFVMISTDKAVNPSSIMGASKRLAELYVQHLNSTRDTSCCMVRFGNVLGSACSVVPIWTKQLEDGGPITVTHPEMTRYFMTIPEAAGLVLQAGMFSGTRPLDDASTAATKSGGTSGGKSGGGEVFLLDMGEPIRILDLARRFVRLQGFEPDTDVEIKITGTRPGEKLFEELAYHSEDMLPTPHQAIRVWKNPPPTHAQMQQIIDTFDRLRNKTGDPDRNWRDASPDAIVTALRSAVPEMIRAAAC